MDSIGTGNLRDEAYDWAVEFNFTNGAQSRIPHGDKKSAESYFDYFSDNPMENLVSLALVRSPKNWQVMKVVDTRR